VKIARWAIGVCFVMACAVPATGGQKTNVTLAKFVELEQPHVGPLKLSPQVKVKESFQYYDIDGLTQDELRSQMKRNGTTWNDGKVYAALTCWDIRYHYDVNSTDGKFRLTGVRTDVDIVFHMPRLIPSAKTPNDLKTSWNEYLEHLQTHESGHRDLAIKIGEEIYQALSSLGNFANKSDLDRAAQAVVQARFEKLKQVQVDYDVETHHGVLQGAVLKEPTVASVPAS